MGARGCYLANCRTLCTDPLAGGRERSLDRKAKYVRINVLPPVYNSIMFLWRAHIPDSMDDGWTYASRTPSRPGCRQCIMRSLKRHRITKEDSEVKFVQRPQDRSAPGCGGPSGELTTGPIRRQRMRVSHS